jgi:3-hydroxyacyl-CoA dehydrogenase
MIRDYNFYIGIIGSGRMGSDILYYLNNFDFKLVWIVIDEQTADDLRGKYLKKLDRSLKNGLISQSEYDKKKAGIIISVDYNKLADCDLIIEAITEDVEIKKDVFKKIAGVVKKKCILSSNSSSLIPSKICPNKNLLDRFIGIHFFYPVQLKNIVELIITNRTSNYCLNIAQQFLKKINKFYLLQNEKNSFVLNKVFLPYQLESYNILKEGKLTVEQIDYIIEKNIFPIGIFKMYDSVGIDIICPSVREYAKTFEHPELFNDFLMYLESMINEKKLGQKTKIGFYDYNNLGNIDFKINDDYTEDIAKRLLYLYINTVYNFIEMNSINEKEADFALKEYGDLNKGPIELSCEIGKNKIYEFLENYFIKTKNYLFKPSSLLKKQ